MEFFEIRALMKNKHYAHKDEWEQARLIMYTVAQTNSKKKLKQTDIIKFPWDEEKDQFEKKNEAKNVSNEDVNRLRERGREMAKMLSKL